MAFIIITARKRVCEGYVFTGVCHSVHRGAVRGCSGGGMCGCSGGGMHGCSRGGVHGCSGGHAWLLPGGVCVVALGEGECAWLLRGRGSVHGCSGGACVVAWGGAWLLLGRGACVVAPGGACMAAAGGGVCGFSDEIRSMSGRYASYWNAFLFTKSFVVFDYEK